MRGTFLACILSPLAAACLLFTASSDPPEPAERADEPPWGQSVTTPLDHKVWTTGTVQAKAADWYEFSAEQGTKYLVQWTGASTEENPASAEVMVSAYREDQSAIFRGQTAGWAAPVSVSDYAGKVFIEVKPRTGVSAAAYALRYYDRDGMAPAVALTLKAGAIVPNDIDIAWNVDLGATGYRLYRATAEDGGYTQIGGDLPVFPRQYRDADLPPNAYRYMLQAFNAQGEGLASPPVTIGTAVFAASALSDNVWLDGDISEDAEDWYRFDASEETPCIVGWNDSQKGDGTKTGDVQVAAYKADGDELFAESANSRDNRQLIFGYVGTVYLRVRASVPGTYAIRYYEDPEAIAPPPPGSVRAATFTLTGGDILITWDKIDRYPAITGYGIYRSDAEDGDSTQIHRNSSYGDDYEDTGLPPGTWWYRVTTVNDLGEGPPSSPVSALTPVDTGDMPALTEGVRTDGKLQKGAVDWYRFEVSAENVYGISRYESSGINGRDMQLAAYKADGSVLISETGSQIYRRFIYGYAGTVYLGVRASASGSYAIRYYEDLEAQAPPPPRSVRVIERDFHGILIAWNTGEYSFATGYGVYFSDAQDGNYTKIAHTASSYGYCYLNPPSPGTWWCRVTTYSVLGEGPPSSPVSIVVPVDAKTLGTAE
jgi:hypothetical protein